MACLGRLTSSALAAALGTILTRVIGSLLAAARLRRLAALRGALVAVLISSAALLLEGFLQPAVERTALLVEQRFEPAFDVLEGGAEVELVERGAALLAELLEQVAQTVHALAHGVAHAALHEVAQGVLQVAEVHQVVGKRLQQIVRIEVRDLLRPVPLRIAKYGHYAVTPLEVVR